MALILTSAVSPTGSRRRVFGLLRYPDRSPVHPETPVTTALDRPPEEAGEDTSFARGLRVFLTIADRGEIRADELSTLLETPLSTIYRYLRTLTEFGFVERQEGGYRLGARLHVIGAGPIVTAEELIRAAEPVLADLAVSTRETAFISRRIGLGAVSLAEEPSPQSLRVVVETGQAGPLHLGAVALVLLAYAPRRGPGRGPGRGRGGSDHPTLAARDRVRGLRTGRRPDVLGGHHVGCPRPAGERDRGRTRSRRAVGAGQSSLAVPGAVRAPPVGHRGRDLARGGLSEAAVRYYRDMASGLSTI